MAELLPSELPLIIKKELIKAEDRINKTRTPNVDQDVVGGMPTDKPDSTSIGETILDILCSQQFLKEWAKRLDDNKQNNLEFVGDKDGKVMKEGAHGLGVRSPAISLSDFYDVPLKNAFYTIAGQLINGYRGSGTYTGTLMVMTRIYNAGPVISLVFREGDRIYEVTKFGGEWREWKEYLTTTNTYPDQNGFLKDRKSDLYALTNNKLTSDLNVDRTDYIASAKSAHDINKKAISAQNTANTAVTNASTAHNRADNAYALAEKKIDKTSIANTLGNSTTLVASQKLVNDVDAKKRDITDTVFERYDYPALILRSTLTEKIGRSIAIENGSGQLFVHYREGDGFASESGQISFRFPNYSDRLAGLSQTAAIGETQYTQWRKAMTLPSSTDLTSIFYASSITEALRDLPANSLFESLESKGSGISIEHRARYRRIIRTGN